MFLNFFFVGRIFSVPIVQKSWDVGKLCVNKMGDFVSDFRNVEGNMLSQFENVHIRVLS